MTHSLKWRISTYSGSGGSCVEMARRDDHAVLVRNSNRRAAGSLAFSPAELANWLDSCRDGSFDDLTA